MDDKKMTNLAETYDYPEGVSLASSKKGKKEKHYPRSSFNLTQMPSLKGYTVGDRVRVTIEAEVTGVSTREKYRETDKTEVSVDLKFLEGAAEKSDATVADEEEEQDKKDDPAEGENGDSKPATEEEKKDKKANDFNKLIDDEE